MGFGPVCRKPYPQEPGVYNPLSQEELFRMKNEENRNKMRENEK
jgi:CCR4-NOT transcription complex subunit 4